MLLNVLSFVEGAIILFYRVLPHPILNFQHVEVLKCLTEFASRDVPGNARPFVTKCLWLVKLKPAASDGTCKKSD